MEVVVGTYEQCVIGYHLYKQTAASDNDAALPYKFEQSFGDANSHIGSVRSIACSERGILASGGTDETIVLLNLASRKDLGQLMQHSGTVTGLQFYNNGHLFSCSDDGTICIYETKRWECLKTLHGHKDSVVGLTVHPSGKLALSIGKDKSLRTWNLITGRRAYITNIKFVADIVKWTPDGDQYIIICNKEIHVYDVATAKKSHTVENEDRIQCADFTHNGLLVVGSEVGKVHIYSVKDKFSHIYSFDTETVRIKSLFCSKPIAIDGDEDNDDDDSSSRIWLVTGSSDGYLKLWAISSQATYAHQLLASALINFRILCVCAYTPTANKLTKDTQASANEVLAEMSDKESDVENSSDEESGDEVIKLQEKVHVVYENESSSKKKAGRKRKQQSKMKNSNAKKLKTSQPREKGQKDGNKAEPKHNKGTKLNTKQEKQKVLKKKKKVTKT